MALVQALNALTLPAALVLCAACASLAWLGTKNFVAGLFIGFALFIAMLGTFLR